MEVFLASIATEEYECMASALIQMGATNRDVDAKAFARDLEKMFSSIQASKLLPILDLRIMLTLCNQLNLFKGISMIWFQNCSAKKNMTTFANLMEMSESLLAGTRYRDSSGYSSWNKFRQNCCCC